MKIIRIQLKEMVRKIVRTKLNENVESGDYEHMLQLKQLYEDDFWVLNKVGPKIYQQILDFREQSEDFYQFKNMVSGMPADMAKQFWDRSLGTVNAKLLVQFKKEYEELKQRFVEEDATSESDMAYGRRAKRIVDTKTGKTIKTSVDRPGSLGT